MYPIGEHNWKGVDDYDEFIAEGSTEVQVRDGIVKLRVYVSVR